MKELSVTYTLQDRGFTVRINKAVLPILYPEKVWQRFPGRIKRAVVENFIFLSTLSMPTMCNRNKVDYKFNSPLLCSFFIRPVMLYIPSGAEEYNKDSFALLRNLLNTTYNFRTYRAIMPEYSPPVANSSVILFTFGKDSLLSFAVAEEIGLKPHPVYIDEPDVDYKDEGGRLEHTYEQMHKAELIKKFMSEFKKPVNRVKNYLSLARISDFFGSSEAELPYGSQLTEYALLALPFNHYYRARYIVYGNEASCSEYYMNKDGIITNPVFEQSQEWTFEITKMLKLLTGKMSAISLLEPLHEIAIVSVLHSRYPHYAKYQMSCFADSEEAKESRWCHSCSKCARIYILLLANGVDPGNVGFTRPMLGKSKKRHYSLFGAESGRPYDMAGLGRDEQLLAFYLACLRNKKGYLIRLFVRRFLGEARKRFRSLMRRYYGLHSHVTIPNRIVTKLMRIYDEELKKRKREIFQLARLQD